MSEIPGTIPPAKSRSAMADRKKVLHPFDEAKEVLEKRGAPPPFSATVWPVIIGGLLSFAAPKLFDIFTGPHLMWVAKAVFPYVLIASEPQFRLYGEYSSQLPQFVLLVQFPFEGVLTMFNLRRRVSAGVSVGLLIVIHLVGAFVLYLLTQR
jgi:hypothetical protein